MTTAEAKLKERVKELTCLYEVTSIIVNPDYEQLETSLEAIVYCLKRAWQFEDDTEVSLEVAEKNKKIQIRITDEGQGIEAKNEDRVFEPFFTTKPHGEGSGLGLSVVHGIIDSHKGTIIHGPNTPKGTIFTVDFPKL